MFATIVAIRVPILSLWSYICVLAIDDVYLLRKLVMRSKL
jgi:hypothetical protein